MPVKRTLRRSSERLGPQDGGFSQNAGGSQLLSGGGLYAETSLRKGRYGGRAEEGRMKTCEDGMVGALSRVSFFRRSADTCDGVSGRWWPAMPGAGDASSCFQLLLRQDNRLC